MTADLKPSVDPCMHGGTVMGGQCLLRSQAHETHLLCIHFLILIRTFWGITVPILQMGMLRSRWKCSTTEIRMCVFLGPGFPGGASGKEPACQCRRHKRCGFYPWVGEIPWKRILPLQYSCLENPIDRGAWQATIHSVTNSWTWLKRLSMHASLGPVSS